MAEWSFPHTTGLGHGVPYSASQFADILKVIHGLPGANEGVYPNQLNELAVSSTGNNNVRVASGNALVAGRIYLNDANKDITVTSPAAGTTGFLVVVRYTASTRLVQALVKKNTDGTATIPAPTQTDGVTWEIPLASGTIMTGGAIGSLTDLREYLSIPGVDMSDAAEGNTLVYTGGKWGPGSSGPWFGDGSDGDVTIASFTTLTRDMYYENLTINAGQQLNTGGYRIFVRDTLTNNGFIQNNGGSNGVAAPSGTVGGGGNGGAVSSYRGGAGAGIVMVAARRIEGSGTIRANGAQGSGPVSATSGGGPGSAASATAPTAAKGGSRHITTNPAAFALARTLDGDLLTGGAGGSFWASSSASAGTATTNSLGGNGGTVNSGAGGAGGGAGGGVLLLTTQADHGLTLQANGGTGTGTGQAGSAGTVLTMVV